MIQVLIHGAAGRMGQLLIAGVQQSETLNLSAAIDRPRHPECGKTINAEVVLSDDLEAALARAEVMIDFSMPSSSIAALEKAAAAGVAAVVGTTGFDRGQQERITALSGDIPIVFSPNMSLGVNLLFKLVSTAAAALPDEYDMEIIEIHHRKKVDAPSGTAVKLGELLAAARGLDYETAQRHSRSGQIGPRPKDEIGFATVRAGEVVGEHTVLLAGPGERLELIHRASSREAFARGALAAASWIRGRAPGLYNMQNVLDLQ